MCKSSVVAGAVAVAAVAFGLTGRAVKAACEAGGARYQAYYFVSGVICPDRARLGCSNFDGV